MITSTNDLPILCYKLLYSIITSDTCFTDVINFYITLLQMLHVSILFINFYITLLHTSTLLHATYMLHTITSIICFNSVTSFYFPLKQIRYMLQICYKLLYSFITSSTCFNSATSFYFTLKLMLHASNLL